MYENGISSGYLRKTTDYRVCWVKYTNNYQCRWFWISISACSMLNFKFNKCCSLLAPMNNILIFYLEVLIIKRSYFSCLWLFRCLLGIQCEGILITLSFDLINFLIFLFTVITSCSSSDWSMMGRYSL